MYQQLQTVDERCDTLARSAFKAAAYVNSQDFGERLASRRIIVEQANSIIAERERDERRIERFFELA